VAATGTELRADVVICTYTFARWELLVRSVQSVLAQRTAPQRLIIVVDHNDDLLARCRQEWAIDRAAHPSKSSLSQINSGEG
jgi:hypothetical protein